MNTPAIRLVVGLGNPGQEYADTRHNAGFWLVERVAQQYRGTLQLEKKFNGRAARVRIAEQEVWLLQPQTFMNRSGQSVISLAQFYKIAPEEILVAHDELDLAPGNTKLKQGGGNAGHNGLKDINTVLGNANFWRLRIGIGHPRIFNLQQDVADFVLHRPSREQQALIDENIQVCLDILPACVRGDFKQAMLALHTKAVVK